MKFQKRKRHPVRSLIVTILVIATVVIPAVSALAADGDLKANHGAVKIYSYNYDAMVNRLSNRYPGIFKTVTVYSTASHQNVSTTTANRALLSNATNHRQNSNTGATAKYLNGTTRSTSNWGQGLSGFEASE